MRFLVFDCNLALHLGRNLRLHLWRKGSRRSGGIGCGLRLGCRRGLLVRIGCRKVLGNDVVRQPERGAGIDRIRREIAAIEAEPGCGHAKTPAVNDRGRPRIVCPSIKGWRVIICRRVRLDVNARDTDSGHRSDRKRGHHASTSGAQTPDRDTYTGAAHTRARGGRQRCGYGPPAPRTRGGCRPAHGEHPCHGSLCEHLPGAHWRAFGFHFHSRCQHNVVSCRYRTARAGPCRRA